MSLKGPYEAFGLSVRSAFPLPELRRLPDEPLEAADLRVRRGTVEFPPTADPEKWVHRSPTGEHYLAYKRADILVKDGSEAVVDLRGDVSAEAVRHIVLGPVLNHALHQRGYFVLHASTVLVDGAAVAFLGESGVGKTTTAMAFLLAGHRVLSDDVAAVVPGTDPPKVRTGYPSIKLDPEMVERFDAPVDEPESAGSRGRHFYGLRHDQPAEPTRLAAVYLLEDGDRLEVEPVPASERVLNLVEYTYTGGVLEADDQAARNFQQAGTVAASAPVKVLRRPRRPEALSEVVERVVADLEAEDGPAREPDATPSRPD